jgi:DNA repair protein RecN (Recombination protein N)
VGIDPQLDALAERLSVLAIESSDLARELRGYVDALDAHGTAIAGDLDEHAGGDLAAGAGADALEVLEARVAEVERIARKHGGEVEAVLAYGERALKRRAELLGANAAAGEDEAHLADARAALAERVATIREGRSRGAPRLARSVRGQLTALAMGDATFDIELTACEPGPSGADEVEFMIAPNPGVPAAPLREIASGGELSRVMLAIMAVAALPGEQATLVFDEVDAGIGGHAARAVGERLRELARTRQVVCITHLPQIASLAERHFSIAKDTSVRPTRASVRELGDSDVVSELVRMLGADDGDSGALRHARELLRAA